MGVNEIEQHSRNLPSWIHPALVQANMETQERKIGKPNGNPKNLELENQIYGTKTGIEKITGIETKQEKIKNSPQRAPSKSIKGLLDFLGLKLEKFNGKNVIDLGGGFGGLTKYIANHANNITIVDPIFLEKNIDDVIQQNIESQKKFIYLREKHINENPEKKHIIPQIQEGNIVLEEMKWWIDYSQIKYPNVIRNPSYAENIVGIENNSQDYVFCNYVLSKETIDIENAIKEINRVLKSGGQLIFTEYERDEKIIDELKKYFTLDIVSDNKDGIIIIGIKK